MRRPACAISLILLPIPLLLACQAQTRTPGQTRELPPGESSPTLEEEAHTYRMLPRSLPLEGSGGAGGIFFPARRIAPVKTEKGATDQEPDEAAYLSALALLYRDFRRSGASARGLEASTLNDLALYATLENDNDRAESLFRLALTKEDSLPVRLNLAFLFIRAREAEGRSMILSLLPGLSEIRRSAVLRELFARGMPEEGAAFLQNWLENSPREISPVLRESAILVASYYQLNDRNRDALRLCRMLEDRLPADPDVLIGLARSLEEPEEGLRVYRRLLSLPAQAFSNGTGPSDEALREHAAIAMKLFAFAEAEKSLASLKAPRYEDIKARILARLRQDPDADVEKLMAGILRIPPQDLRTMSPRIFVGTPGAPGINRPGFRTMLDGGLGQILPHLAVIRLRQEIFGTSDAAQAEKDRRALRRVL